MENIHTSNAKYLLALHSCSESFGIAIKDINNPQKEIKTKTFNLGRSLSNKIISCIETLLPKESWINISRISVAKGPGSFTSTRLTLSLARTIAQQLNCSVDALSSFHLMAPRLHELLNYSKIDNGFWIKDTLPRRGILAGKYQLIKIHKKYNFYEFNELVIPHLIKNEKDLTPSINASNNIEKDIISLIKFSEYRYSLKIYSNWTKVLPLYPTSPLDNKKI